MGQGGAKTICQEEENFYKVCHLVLDEIPAHLRQYFKQLWDITYPTTPWDDTASSGQLLLNAESNRNTKTLIRTRMQDGDRSKWDGTALFAVLLYSSQTFTSINPNAVSCIDQLRIIRNSHFAHLDSAKVSNSAYQKIFSDAKQMFTQMNWSLNGISAIENSRTSATDGVNLLRQLQEERARHDNLEKWIQTVEDDVAQLSLNNQELVKHLKDTDSKQDTLADELKQQVKRGDELGNKQDAFSAELKQHARKLDDLDSQLKAVPKNTIKSIR